jgi:hypothetical protein
MQGRTAPSGPHGRVHQGDRAGLAVDMACLRRPRKHHRQVELPLGTDDPDQFVVVETI